MAKLKEIPIRVLLGYLSDSTEKDALAFALGIAEKHTESGEISYYSVFKYDKGYVYEIHEGGLGRAFTPSIIKYFKENAHLHTADSPLYAVIPTSTRLVYVEKAMEGIQAMLMPEIVDNPEHRPSTWLRVSDQMRPAVPKRTGILITGLVLLGLGVVSLWGAMLTRYQPYSAQAVPAPEKINYQEYPISQWAKIQSQQGIGALEFIDGKWEVKKLGSKQASETKDAAANPTTPTTQGEKHP